MADLPIQEAPQKTGFLGTLMNGVKGLVAGGAVGGIVGGLLGAAATAAFMLLTAGSGGLTLLAVGIGAGIGAASGGTILAGIGALAGVKRTDEQGQISSEDVGNVAKIAFAQGVSVGTSMDHGHATKTTHAIEQKERAAAAAMAATQVHH